MYQWLHWAASMWKSEGCLSGSAGDSSPFSDRTANPVFDLIRLLGSNVSFQAFQNFQGVVHSGRQNLYLEAKIIKKNWLCSDLLIFISVSVVKLPKSSSKSFVKFICAAVSLLVFYMLWYNVFFFGLPCNTPLHHFISESPYEHGCSLWAWLAPQLQFFSVLPCRIHRKI